MTAFPTINTAFADGVAATKSDMRDFGNATVERIGGLPADYSSYTEQAILCVNADSDGPTVATSSDTVSFNGAKSTNQEVIGIRYTTVAVSLSSGAAELDMSEGHVFDVDVDDDIADGGLTLANAPTDFSIITVRLLNDSTGGYTIAGGSNVSDAFADASFEFPSEVTWPSGADTFVLLTGYRLSASDKYRMKLADRED